MKRYILFILMILYVLPLTACGKYNKHVIEITVPAGSQEKFVCSEERRVSDQDMSLRTDTFWDDVTKIVYYGFDEEIYEVSDPGKLEEIQAIFTEMKYKEIKNPWLEGWYLFKIHTDEKVYDMSISGKIIRFDEKFYKVTESIAEEIVKETKEVFLLCTV